MNPSGSATPPAQTSRAHEIQQQLQLLQRQCQQVLSSRSPLELESTGLEFRPLPPPRRTGTLNEATTSTSTPNSLSPPTRSTSHPRAPESSPPVGPPPPPTRTERPTAPVREQRRGQQLPRSSVEDVAVPHARMSSSQFFLLPSARRANSRSAADSAAPRQEDPSQPPRERPAPAEQFPSRSVVVRPSQTGSGLEYDGKHVPPPPLPFRLPSSSSSSSIAAAHPAPNAVRPAEPVSQTQHQVQQEQASYHRQRHPSSDHVPTGSGTRSQNRRTSTASATSHPAHAEPSIGFEASPTLMKDGSRRGSHLQSPQAPMSPSSGPPPLGVDSHPHPHSRPHPALDLPHPDSFLSPLVNPSHGDRGATHMSLHSRPQNPSAASTYRSSQNSGAPSDTTSTRHPPPLPPNGFHARPSSSTPAAAGKTSAAVYNPQGCVNPSDPGRKSSSPSSPPTQRPGSPEQPRPPLQSQRDHVAQVQGQVQRQARPQTHAHGQAPALAIVGWENGGRPVLSHHQQTIPQSRSHPNLNLRGWESEGGTGAAADRGGRGGADTGSGVGRQRPSRIAVPSEHRVRAPAHARPPQPPSHVDHDLRPHPHAPPTHTDRRTRAYTNPHPPPPLFNSQTQSHTLSQARVPHFHVHAPPLPMPVSLPLSMPAPGPRPVPVSLQMPRHPAFDPASLPEPPGGPDLLDALEMDNAAAQLLHAAVEDALLPLRLAMEVDMPRICGEFEVGLQGLGHVLHATTTAVNVGMLEGATVVGPTNAAGVTGTGAKPNVLSKTSLDAQNAPREHEPFEVAVERLRRTKEREELREELRTSHALWEAERKGWEAEVVKCAEEKANWREEKARLQQERSVHLEEKTHWLDKQAKWEERKRAWEGEEEKWVAEKVDWEEERRKYESTLEEKERELQEQKANNKQLGMGILDVCQAMDARAQHQAQVEAQGSGQAQAGDGGPTAAAHASSPVAAETQPNPDDQVLTQLQERADTTLQHVEISRLETQLEKTTRIMQGYREECKRLRAEKETLEFQLLVRNGSVAGASGGATGVLRGSPGVVAGGSPGAVVGAVVGGRGRSRGRPRGHGQGHGQRQGQGHREGYSYAAYPPVPTLTLGRASTASMTTSSNSSTPTMTTTAALAAQSMATAAALGEASGPDPTSTAIVPSTSNSSSSLMSTGTTATSSSLRLSPSSSASSAAATSASNSTSMETIVRIGSGTVRITLPLFSQPTSPGTIAGVSVSESGHPMVFSVPARAATPIVVDPPLPPGQLDVSSPASAHTCAPPLPFPLASISPTSTPSDPSPEAPTPLQDPDVNEGLDLSFEPQGDADEAEEGRRSLTAADASVGTEREDGGSRKPKRHRTEWEEPKVEDIKKLKLDPDLDSSASAVTPPSSIQDFAMTDVKNEPDHGAGA